MTSYEVGTTMRQAKLYRYCLPMDSGVILREQKLTAREGWVVELSDNGSVALGEIAPLPGFSQESLEAAGVQAQAQLELWVHHQPTDIESCYPSVAFGLSAALLELDGKLPAEGNYRAAPLCSGDPDELIPKLNNMQGKKVAKIKVGLYEAIRDGMIVSLLLESIPDLTLRLDANRSWTLEKAKQFAKYVAPCSDSVLPLSRNLASNLVTACHSRLILVLLLLGMKPCKLLFTKVISPLNILLA